MSDKPTIGAAIALDGEKEFKAAVKEIDQNMKVLGSELKKVASAFGAEEKSVESLSAQNKVLNKQIEEQKSKISTLQSALDAAKSRFDSSRQAVSALRDQLEQAKQTYGENSDEVKALEKSLGQAETAYKKNQTAVANWQIKLNNAETALNQTEKAVSDNETAMRKMADASDQSAASLEKVSQKAKDAADKVSKIGSGMGTVGSALTKSVTVPLAAGATAAVAAMNDVDDGLDTIATKTGATGAEMEEMQGILYQVASEIPAEFSDMGAAIGEVSTRLNLTGDELTAASEAFLKFAKVNGSDVNTSVQLVTRAMGDAGISAGEYMSVLDALTVAGQESGISVDTLAESLAKYGAPLRALGIDTEQAIAMFAGWEKAGVNTQIAFSGMRQAISNWSKAGQDATVEFSKTLETIKACPDIASATEKAIEVFGAKAGPDLADAIREGRFEFEDYVTAIQNGGGALESSYAMIVDGVDDTQIAIQEAKTALHDIGETLMKTAGPILKDAAEWLKDLTDKFNSLDEETQQNIVKFAALAAALGPVIKLVGSLTTGASKAIKGVSNITSAIKKWSTASQTASTAAGGLTKASGGIATMLGSGGPVVAAVGVAAAAIGGVLYASYQKAEEEAEALAEGWKDFVDAGTEFSNGVDTARGALDGFNDEVLISNEKMQEYEEKITTARENIHGIAEHAASESRELTEAEREEIENLIGMIDSYTSKKLEAYDQQQKVVAAMASREEEMTTTAAQEYYKSAVDTYNETLTQAQAYRASKYAEAQKKFDQNLISEEDLKKFQDQADAYYAEAEAKAIEHYGNTSAIIANAYYEQNLAGNENLQRVQEINQRLAALKEEEAYLDGAYLRGGVSAAQAAFQESRKIESEREDLIKEMTDIVQGETGEQIACWMQMAADAELYGGKVSEQSQSTATEVQTAFSNLPEKVKEKFSDMMEGAVLGIGEKIGKVTDAVGGVVTSVIKTITSGFDIHSPSRVMRRLFGHVMQGGIKALNDSRREMEKAATKVVADTNKAFQNLKIPNMEALLVDYSASLSAARQVRMPIFPADTESAAVPSAVGQSTITVPVTIQNFYNNRDTDVQDLSNRIAAGVRLQIMSKGGKPR